MAKFKGTQFLNEAQLTLQNYVSQNFVRDLPKFKGIAYDKLHVTQQ